MASLQLSHPGFLVVSKQLNYPAETRHGWKYLAFGPDSQLCAGQSAVQRNGQEPVCKHATSMNGTGREVFASGVRNSVGFTWHPETKELWFTVLATVLLGDDVPNCGLDIAHCKMVCTLATHTATKAPLRTRLVTSAPVRTLLPAEKLGPHVAPSA